MITVSLSDDNFNDNFESIKYLKQTGRYSDEKIQELYNRQLEIDKQKEFGERNTDE